MIGEVFREALSTGIGIAGVAILAGLAVVSLAFLLTAPGDVVAMWNSPEYWMYNPRIAMPEWFNYFGLNLPKTEIVKLSATPVRDGIYELRGSLSWRYSATPSEVVIEVNSTTSNALLRLSIARPDGAEVSFEIPVTRRGLIRMNVDIDRELSAAVKRALGEGTPSQLLFSKDGEVLQGRYTFSGVLYSFDGGFASVRVVLYGRVHGLAGTDDLRRDLFVGIMFGIPIAFVFGVATAFTTAFVQSFFGILAGWFGRRVDVVIDRLTDIFLLLPFLPVLITIAIFIGKFTLSMLFVAVVGLSLFGSITKAVRSLTLQLKSSQYVEAAKLAGAGSMWIITRHLLPAVIPFTFANAVISVPTFVYLEAALSLVGFGDPFLPTLGQLLERTFAQGALYNGYWWWILTPSSVLILITLGFAFFGYALDKAVNPRLRRR